MTKQEQVARIAKYYTTFHLLEIGILFGVILDTAIAGNGLFRFIR